jgi:hypothetical protein
VLIAIVAWLAIAIGGMVTLGLLLPRADDVTALVAAAIVMLVASAVSYVLGRSLSRRGCAILGISGARFTSGGIEVFCPWPLFSEPGHPDIQLSSSFSLRPLPSAVVLPVASALVPRVTASRNGSIIASGMDIKARHARFNSPHEMILKRLGGRDEWNDLAPLLLDLGRALGRKREAFAVPEAAVSPPRQDGLGLTCPKCGSRAVSPRRNPSILDGKTGYQCDNCRLRMAPLRSRVAIWSLLATAVALAVATLIHFALLFLYAGGPEKGARRIQLTLLVWFLFCVSCVVAAIVELLKPVPTRNSRAN